MTSKYSSPGGNVFIFALVAITALVLSGQAPAPLEDAYLTVGEEVGAVAGLTPPGEKG